MHNCNKGESMSTIALEKTIDMDFLFAQDFIGIESFCALTNQCLNIVNKNKINITLADIQRHFINSNLVVIITKDNEIKGVAAFENAKDVLTLNFIVLAPEIQKKGISIKICKEAIAQLNPKYFLTSIPADSPLMETLPHISGVKVINADTLNIPSEYEYQEIPESFEKIALQLFQ